MLFYEWNQWDIIDSFQYFDCFSRNHFWEEGFIFSMDESGLIFHWGEWALHK